MDPNVIINWLGAGLLGILMVSLGVLAPVLLWVGIRGIIRESRF